MKNKPDITIIGIGYVGLTLAVTLADLDFNVLGYDLQSDVVAHLNNGESHILEPGVDEVLKARVDRNLSFTHSLPDQLQGVVIICVSTPVAMDGSTNLTNLKLATETIATRIHEEALVIVRSTVPVGTARGIVSPILRAVNPQVRLASCPERTIQGQALSELKSLPQIVGGIDDVSLQSALELWRQVSDQVVPMTSLESAEMVKLINNSHTDLIYSFGNEVALMAQHLKLDPMELIQAANQDYPRPNLARPGFVSGPCLSKDSYLLLNSLEDHGYKPALVSNARQLNRNMPSTVAQHFIEALKTGHQSVKGAKVLVCGFAYKGWPITDDTRDSPAIPIVKMLLESGVEVYGHDYVVPEERISAFGAHVVSNLEKGFEGVQGVFVLNEHPSYRSIDIGRLAGTMGSPGIIYDSWRVLDVAAIKSIKGIRYMSIGYG